MPSRSSFSQNHFNVLNTVELVKVTTLSPTNQIQEGAGSWRVSILTLNLTIILAKLSRVNKDFGGMQNC